MCVCRMAPKWCSFVTVFQHENQFHVNSKGGRTTDDCVHVYDTINVKNVVCMCAWLLAYLLACLPFSWFWKNRKINANKITAYTQIDTHVCLHAYKRTQSPHHTMNKFLLKERNERTMLCKRPNDVYKLQWVCVRVWVYDMKLAARVFVYIYL